MGRLGKLLVVCAVVGFAAQAANAELVVSVQGPAGENKIAADPGDIVDLVVNLDGPGSDTFDSFFFLVDMSSSLSITGYDFPQDTDDGAGGRRPVFAPGSPDDFSNPPEFEAATSFAGDKGGPGVLVTFQVDTAGTVDGDSFAFDIVPDFFSDGFSDRDAVAGQTFTLTIPEPMTLALLGIGGLVALRRRRTA